MDNEIYEYSYLKFLIHYIALNKSIIDCFQTGILELVPVVGVLRRFGMLLTELDCWFQLLNRLIAGGI